MSGRPVILCELNLITETIQVPVGRMLVSRDLTCHWIQFCADNFFWGGEEEFIIVMSSPGLLNPRWPWRHFGMRKYFVTHSNARPAQNAKAILKTYELFIYRDVHYIPHSFCKGCWNSDTVAHCICSEILILLSECIFTLHHASKNTQVKLYVYLLIFNYL